MKKLLIVFVLSCMFLCGCNSVCDICGREDDCSKYTYTVHDPTTDSDIEKKFNLCQICHIMAENGLTDKSTYDYVVTAIHVALTDEKANAAMCKCKEAYITITKNGIEYENVDQAFIDALHWSAPSIDTTRMSLLDSRIRLEGDGRTVYVTREKKPYYVLDEKMAGNVP